MKEISASIIVLASSVIIVGGIYLPSGPTRTFLWFVGFGIGFFGFAAWISRVMSK